MHFDAMQLSNLERCDPIKDGFGLANNNPEDIELHFVPKKHSQMAGEHRHDACECRPKQIASREYKKYFSAVMIAKKKSSNKSCFFDTKIRLTGDITDHIIQEKSRMSVKVKLKMVPFLALKNFKLFIPKSRKGDQEIIINYFAERLNFISPKTVKIRASINGSKTFYMLFQEDLNADFLQRNKKRDGPIVEPDEYTKMGDGRLSDWDVRYSFAKIANKKYVGSGKNYANIGIEAISRLNFGLLAHQRDMQLKGKCCVDSFSDVFDNNYLALGDKKNFLELEKFDAFLEIFGGTHGLVPTNRKFYFDPMTSQILPIIYDSNARFFATVDLINSIKNSPSHALILNQISALHTDQIEKRFAISWGGASPNKRNAPRH